jgi:hypothetical protein
MGFLATSLCSLDQVTKQKSNALMLNFEVFPGESVFGGARCLVASCVT